MGLPFRRYCFSLAAKLGKTLDEVLAMDANDIAEWMAYDLTNDEKFIEMYKAEQTKNMSEEEYSATFKALLGT